MSGLVKFSINLEANGKSIVQVADRDVSDQIAGFTLQARVGSPPVLTLQHLAASGSIEGEGIVQVNEAGESITHSQIVRRFLATVDPDELDSASLDASDWGEQGIARSMLRVLARWAGGD